MFTDINYRSLPLTEELLENLTYICRMVKLNRNCLLAEAKWKQFQKKAASQIKHHGITIVYEKSLNGKKWLFNYDLIVQRKKKMSYVFCPTCKGKTEMCIEYFKILHNNK